MAVPYDASNAVRFSSHTNGAYMTVLIYTHAHTNICTHAHTSAGGTRTLETSDEYNDLTTATENKNNRFEKAKSGDSNGVITAVKFGTSVSCRKSLTARAAENRNLSADSAGIPPIWRNYYYT